MFPETARGCVEHVTAVGMDVEVQLRDHSANLLDPVVRVNEDVPLAALDVELQQVESASVCVDQFLQRDRFGKAAEFWVVRSLTVPALA